MRDSVTRQDSVQRRLDSLAAQLARTEAALQLLREQVATESSAMVRFRSRVQADLSARLVVNGFRTHGAVSNNELPAFAIPVRPVAGAPSGVAARSPRAFGMSMRQVLLGANASVDSVAGATLLADVELDLFARGFDPTPPLFPEPRLRTARVFLVWPRTEIMVGAETPLISDMNPISVSAVAVPAFSTAGNLWNWLPQLRVTRTVWAHAERPWTLALQGAVMSPYANDRAPQSPQGPDVGQLSGRPALESRLRVRGGDALDDVPAQGVLPRGLEVGVGTHTSWLAAGDSLLRSWALSADLRIALGAGFELRGEAYRGRLLRGLGGGAIGQNFSVSPIDSTQRTPLTDMAGWLQLNAQWHPRLIAGVGCGTDRVEGGAVDRRRNTVCGAHSTWRPRQPLFLALEYRHFRTRYADGLRRGGQWNLALGIDL